MRITILSVGRLKSGPELDLSNDYAERFRKAGRALGYRSLDILEVDSGGGMDAEGDRLISKVPQGAHTLRLDEHGRDRRSEDFSTQLARLRDDGVSDLCFLIGGAEGYSHAVQEAVPGTMSFGKQTWPHRLVRAMLCEQLYRAVSIEAGLPYHKA